MGGTGGKTSRFFWGGTKGPISLTTALWPGPSKQAWSLRSKVKPPPVVAISGGSPTDPDNIPHGPPVPGVIPLSSPVPFLSCLCSRPSCRPSSMDCCRHVLLCSFPCCPPSHCQLLGLSTWFLPLRTPPSSLMPARPGQPAPAGRLEVSPVSGQQARRCLGWRPPGPSAVGQSSLPHTPACLLSGGPRLHSDSTSRDSGRRWFALPGPSWNRGLLWVSLTNRPCPPRTSSKAIASSLQSPRL